MRIIFLNRFFHPDHSATSQLVSDLAFHLAAGGRDVAAVTSRQRIDDSRADLPARERTAAVSVHRVWTTRLGRGPGRVLDYLTFYLFAGLRLWRLARIGDLVVVKTDPPLVSVVAAWICRRRGASYINWLQDLFPEVAHELGVAGVGPRLTRWLAGLRDRSLRTARMNVAVGESMDRRLAAAGIPAARRRVVHNWVDGEPVRPDAEGRDVLRAELGLEGRFVVAYSGNMGRAHEFDTALDAAARLGHDPRVVFLFVGDGVRRVDVVEGARVRGLENVRFAPYQPRKRLGASLALADVHLVTLRPQLEGLVVPSKFYGVAAAGRPTLFVGSSDGEIARLLRDASCGFCVEVGENERLAGHIIRLMDEPDLRQRLGRNARALFERRFSRERALAAWAALIDET